jgi:cation diffusion facilitator CzcD-associated flavoprotein CzcO
MMEMINQHVDVLIVGAGLSGIGAGYHLQQNCPGKSYVILEGRKVEHHPAMASADVPAFMVDLLAVGTVAARALAFTILTVARTDETIAMRWREVRSQEQGLDRAAGTHERK